MARHIAEHRSNSMTVGTGAETATAGSTAARRHMSAARCAGRAILAALVATALGPAECDATAPVALVLMTRDDLGLLRPWLAYHGDAFGFENLFVFDGSTGEQAGYLRAQSKQFGFHLKQSDVNLNEISNHLAAWIDDIKGGYDWIFKVDTDEFLTSAEPGNPPKIGYGLEGLRLPPRESAEHLRMTWLITVAPVESGNPLRQVRATFDPAGAFKQAYSGVLFAPSHFNLGSHSLRNNFSTGTNAAIVHYHSRSYADMVRMSIQATVGHGYVADGDSKEVMLQKISKLMERMPMNPETGKRPCAMNSCHKVWIVYNDLVNHTSTKARFYDDIPDNIFYPGGGVRKVLPILRGWQGRLEKVVVPAPPPPPPPPPIPGDQIGRISLGTSGERFVARRVRKWAPARLGPPPDAGAFYPKPESTGKCAAVGVVTTINPCTPAIQKVGEMKGWCLVVVGDTKTDAESYLALKAKSAPGKVTYLSYEDQLKLPYKLVSVTPSKHFGRKNIGYLYAIHMGATTIFDFDDDNEVIGDTIPDNFDRQGAMARTGAAPVSYALLNPYALWPGGSGGMWPRGFPLTAINSQPDVNPEPGVRVVGVVQSLANIDPDVDAIYRLGPRVALPLPYLFPKRPQGQIVLGAGVYAPWNAQATLFNRGSMWAMLLPTTVHGRVSDIWRSYIAQRLMWTVKQHVMFHDAFVSQTRNVHDYMGDFMSERPLYTSSEEIIRVLNDELGLTPKMSLPEAMEATYIALYEFGFVEEQDVTSAQRWLQDLYLMGYEWPQVAGANK